MFLYDEYEASLSLKKINTKITANIFQCNKQLLYNVSTDIHVYKSAIAKRNFERFRLMFSLGWYRDNSSALFVFATSFDIQNPVEILILQMYHDLYSVRQAAHIHFRPRKICSADLTIV